MADDCQLHGSEWAVQLVDDERARRLWPRRSSTVTCHKCCFFWYRGGLCLEHFRHFLPKKGWCYEMGLQSLRGLGGVQNRSGTESVPAKDEAFAKKMPTLWEFLSAKAWEDGTERETGTILVFVEDGLVKVCLCNRDTGHVAFVSAKSFSGALESVEKHLAADTVDWRLSRAAKGKKAK